MTKPRTDTDPLHTSFLEHGATAFRADVQRALRAGTLDATRIARLRAGLPIEQDGRFVRSLDAAAQYVSAWQTDPVGHDVNVRTVAMAFTVTAPAHHLRTLASRAQGLTPLHNVILVNHAYTLDDLNRLPIQSLFDACRRAQTVFLSGDGDVGCVATALPAATLMDTDVLTTRTFIVMRSVVNGETDAEHESALLRCHGLIRRALGTGAVVSPLRPWSLATETAVMMGISQALSTVAWDFFPTHIEIEPRGPKIALRFPSLDNPDVIMEVSVPTDAVLRCPDDLKTWLEVELRITTPLHDLIDYDMLIGGFSDLADPVPAAPLVEDTPAHTWDDADMTNVVIFPSK